MLIRSDWHHVDRSDQRDEACAFGGEHGAFDEETGDRNFWRVEEMGFSGVGCGEWMLVFAAERLGGRWM